MYTIRNHKTFTKRRFNDKFYVLFDLIHDETKNETVKACLDEIYDWENVIEVKPYLVGVGTQGKTRVQCEVFTTPIKTREEADSFADSIKTIDGVSNAFPIMEAVQYTERDYVEEFLGGIRVKPESIP